MVTKSEKSTNSSKSQAHSGRKTNKTNRKDDSETKEQKVDRKEVKKEDGRHHKTNGSSKASSVEKDVKAHTTEEDHTKIVESEKGDATSEDKQTKKSEMESSKSSQQTEKFKDKKDERAESDDDEEEEEYSSDDEEEESDEEENPLFAELASKYNLQVVEEEPEEERKAEEEDRKDTITPINVVDLTNLSFKYSGKNRSTMKHILVDYGLPDSDEKKYKREKKKKKKRSEYRDNSEDEADQEREKYRTERYGHVYSDVSRLRDYLKEDYMEKLTEKVAQQRKDIKKKSEELERKLLEREEKSKEAERYQKRLQRHDLSHDNSFLQTMPKSDAYKMVGWENKLRNAGKLKTRQDLEEFWEQGRNPASLHHYLRKIGAGAPSSNTTSEPPASAKLEDSFLSSRSSSMSSITQEKEPTVLDFHRPLTQIEETKEPSRPSTRDATSRQQWAITQMATQKHGLRNKSANKGSLSPVKSVVSIPSSPSKKSQDPHQIAKQAAAELDKKHPMMELPKLHCFEDDSGDNTVDPQEIIKEMAAKRREKERQLFVKRIRKMYHLSQSNAASTQRIIERREDDFTRDEEAPPTDTWLSSYDLDDDGDCERLPLTLEDEYFSHRPWLKHVRHRAIVTIVEESEPPSQKTSASVLNHRLGSGGGKVSRRSSIESAKPPHIMPLSLDGVTETAKVVEAKCLSTMWSNYLSAGKSVYAK